MRRLALLIVLLASPAQAQTAADVVEREVAPPDSHRTALVDSLQEIPQDSSWSHWRGHLNDVLAPFFPGPAVESDAAPANGQLRLDAPRTRAACGRTTLRYHLGERGRVTVAVYDNIGRRVAIVAEGTQPAGMHEVSLSARSLRPGRYVVRATGAVGTAFVPLVVER